MNKKCKSCGSDVPEYTNFCPVCGNTDFAVNNNRINQADNNQQVQFEQQWQPPVPQNQPKKKKKVLVLGVVVAVIIVIAGLGGLAEKIFQSQGYGKSAVNNGYSDDRDLNNTEVSYSKGTFDGTVYVNDWADIKLELPDGFSNASSDYYNASENSTTECGMYFVSDDVKRLVYICYERLPSFASYNEEEYLDLFLKSLKNDTSGSSYEISDTYSTAIVGGYSYLKAEGMFNNGKVNFAITLHVRKLDNYMIVIGAMGDTYEYNNALVDNITNVK